jgi:hypothetical protein
VRGNGSETESARAALLFRESSDSTLALGQRIAELQAISDYQIPLTWNLPIEVKDGEQLF